MTDTFAGLYLALSPERRRRLFLIFPLIAIGVLAELASIGAVLSFLALLTEVSGSGASNIPLAPDLTDGSPDRPVATALYLLIAAAVAAAAMRLLILRQTQNFALMVAHDLSIGMYARMLRQPYRLYVSRNSSELLSSVEKLQVAVSSVMMPLVQGAAAALMVVFITIALFFIDAAVASTALLVVGFFYSILNALAHRRLTANSSRLSDAATARMKLLQESLSSIRDITIDGSQAAFEKVFKSIDLRFRKAQALVWFMGAAPRFVVEAAGVITLGIVALYMSGSAGSLAQAVPVLGAMALGAQRLIPLIQMIYLAVSNFAGHHQLLRDMLTILEAPTTVTEPQTATAEQTPRGDVIFDSVCFQYDMRDEPTFRNVDIHIPAGSRIGIVGETGSGKSTFFDLLMALIEPTRGTISVGGVPLTAKNQQLWQQNVAHVPQTIYLIDDTIEANIAFSRPYAAFDPNRVTEAAKQAHIHDFIVSLPEGYRTRVGERGIRISGGERQRIAIARALYKEASILVLDEATSALDEDTERAVVQSLSKLDRQITLVIAAHRPSALPICDRILRVAGGAIINEAGNKT